MADVSVWKAAWAKIAARWSVQLALQVPIASTARVRATALDMESVSTENVVVMMTILGQIVPYRRSAMGLAMQNAWATLKVQSASSAKDSA